MYWFNTILLSRSGLTEAFNQPSMKKKYAYRIQRMLQKANEGM